ncbi:Uu.00g013010.m01.CDS01 [Anthostomella pinea]|uniref:Uu.00g013010.m01.CDS01 n=1 Tax=Anthostomella pinea TaxID=933095 RepID=A0AAI8VY41_9PEZI|nr:Uu.00g013010.m01.CDS01 [Anthostomella pinea]
MDRDSPKDPGVRTAKPNGRKNAVQPFGPGTRRPARKNSIASATDAGAATNTRPRIARPNTHQSRQSESFASRPNPSYSLNRSISNSTTFGASRDPTSPRDTRIPRPKTTAPIANHPSTSSQHSQSPSSPMRQPMDLTAAFRRAMEQEAEEHNDSDDTVSSRQSFNLASARVNGTRGVDGSPSPAPRTYRRDSHLTFPRRTTGNRRDSDLGRHLQQFDQHHQLNGGNGPLNGLFTKNRIGPKVSETGHALAKKASDSSLRGSPSSRPTSHRGRSPNKHENAKAMGTSESPASDRAGQERAAEDIPVPSIEYQSASDDRSSPSPRPTHPSPEKSHNWHLDADFTAGDLQISASPRVRLVETKADPNGESTDPVNSPAPGTPSYRRSNTRLQQIREREVEAAKASFPEDESSLRKESPLRVRKNTRLDELRAREMEAVSRRAVASSRLDEIRIKNFEARSKSPEVQRPAGKENVESGPVQVPPQSESLAIPKNNSDPNLRGEAITGTPITVFRNLNNKDDDASSRLKEGGVLKVQDDDKSGPLPRNDSHELLRRLARATSSSPPGEKGEETEKPEEHTTTVELPLKPVSDERDSSRPRLTREERRSRNLEVKGSRERPTVGFVGLRRVLSSDSTREKRASLANSEADPTDRIEAEMDLFALADNYSEKGSVRAPSPDPSEPMEEETPRPTRIDPMTLPTPRVTGAYVKTPATVRVKEETRLSKDQEELSGCLPVLSPEIIPVARNRDSSRSPIKQPINNPARDRAKASGSSLPRSSSVPATRRRARSSSRHRRHPPINTAKPPTVRDDIRAILRTNQIDDSTLEDFDSILASQETDDKELRQMIDETLLKVEDNLAAPEITDRERELDAYDRMSKSLKTGLLGIRSAKKGIERLEDKVTHTEPKDNQVLADPDIPSTKFTAHATPMSTERAAFMITIPPLYRRTPRFRLTTFGLLTLLLAVWYALESAFSFLYAGPQYECTPRVPCDWSPNEPYFPYTMPFMLDEWTTGGKGRAMTWRIGEEVGDVVAEISDWVTNTDFTQFDQTYMNVWERKRQRRRLRKHGLVPKWVEPPGYQSQYLQWHSAKVAREPAEEYGYDFDYESMGADEVIG